MITPQTFMFISSYEQTRKFIINNMNIEKLVHFGLGGVFDSALVDTAMYVLKKVRKTILVNIYNSLHLMEKMKKEDFRCNMERPKSRLNE